MLQYTHRAENVILDVLWYEIKNRVANIDPGAFVIMPNHVQGILVLKENTSKSKNDIDGDANVETLHARSLHTPSPSENTDKNEFMSNISPKSGSVSAIIRSYKSALSKHAHRSGFKFFMAVPFIRSHHQGRKIIPKHF